MSRPVFVDTSGLYAVLDAADRSHGEAATAWRRLIDGIRAHELSAVTHGGVVVEAAALVQRRLGLAAARTLLDDFVGACDVVWIDDDLHREAVTALLASGRREVSLVDWTSFVVMRRQGIDSVLAFDDHFVQQGFRLFT